MVSILVFEGSARNGCAKIEEIWRFVKGGKRLGVLFVTQNGKEGEGILGMITAWDLGKI